MEETTTKKYYESIKFPINSTPVGNEEIIINVKEL
jgi:hypothetical protein